MDYDTIQLERRGAGAWITLNRPGQMNAITVQMLDELAAAMAECQADKRVRVLVLTGKGKAFCAGADLKGVLDGINNVPPGSKDFLDKCDDVFGMLRAFPRPVIAAVNGLAVAGGLELVMCCDIVFAAQNARLGDAHANFGIFPGAGGAAILPRKVGLNRSKYLLFSGEFISASEMERYGLVNQVVPDADLAKEVEQFVKMLSRKSPVVLRRMKEVVNASLDQSMEGALRHEMIHLRQHFRSHDLQEGIRAFTEKREPEFNEF